MEVRGAAGGKGGGVEEFHEVLEAKAHLKNKEKLIGHITSKDIFIEPHHQYEGPLACPLYKALQPDLLCRLVPQLRSDMSERFLIGSCLLASRQDGAVRLAGGRKVKGQH